MHIVTGRLVCMLADSTLFRFAKEVLLAQMATRRPLPHLAHCKGSFRAQAVRANLLTSGTLVKGAEDAC